MGSTAETETAKKDCYDNPGAFGCSHYQRKCQLVTPCCDKVYRCRFCHDEKEDHGLDGLAVREVVCSGCDQVQEIRKSCGRCGQVFGAYSCLECKLFDDDEDKRQFHCAGCQICRIGKASDYFHCETCNMCLPVGLSGGNHTCIEDVSRKDCPVCLEDIHTSREPSHIPPCHHLIHKTCYASLIHNQYYRCPVCLKSLSNSIAWHHYDTLAEENPMPSIYKDVFAKVKCFDCGTNGTTSFHIFGLKCQRCGGYNTARGLGPLYKLNNNKVMVEFDPRVEENNHDDEETSRSANLHETSVSSSDDSNTLCASFDSSNISVREDCDTCHNSRSPRSDSDDD